MALGEFIEVVGRSVERLAGWRYLLSPTHRRRTHDRWKEMSRAEVIGIVLTFGVSFVLVTLVVGGLLWWLFFGEA
jgi:hypothetical protein